MGRESGLESVAREAALSDDGLQRADSDFGMIRNWDRYDSTIGTPLHDYVTASLRTIWKLCCSRMRHTSRPERMRSLPMRRFKTGDKDLGAKPAFYFGMIGTF
jgi:hypothetical protein